jgi:hypothetical protein
MGAAGRPPLMQHGSRPRLCLCQRCLPSSYLPLNSLPHASFLICSLPLPSAPTLCCRYDAGDASLASDLVELRAAMQPVDAAALRLRGNARFQAQDYDGALEAFTLLLGMPAHLASGGSLRHFCEVVAILEIGISS